MLQVFFGSDRKAVVDAGQAAASALGESSVVIDENNFMPGQFEELVASTSLFGETQVYVIDTPSSNSDFNEAFLDAIKEVGESANHFIVLEGAVLAPIKKKFAKHASSTEEFSADKAERFNTFALADALARKDKRSLWMIMQEAQLLGIREEEIIGILWWQLKAIRLAVNTATASEAGMKDYPYRKAKQALQKFSAEEINTHSQSLLALYHQGHKGKVDLKLGLEKWVLQM